MGEAESRVLDYMTSNGGVVTRSEAIAFGMSPATISRRVREGRLVAVGRGTYVLPGVLRDELTALAAATAALAAVVSHESAGRLHRIDGLDLTRVTVTVPVRRSNRFHGVIVHQSTDLTSEDVVEVDGLPTTDVERTIVDLAAVIGEKLLGRVVDQVGRRKLTTFARLSARLEGTARRGKPGVTRLRGVLAPRLGSIHVSESELETRLIELLDGAGLRPPRIQYRPTWLKSMNGRVDLAYPDARVIVEGDGRQWHGDAESFQADRRRDNLAQLAGWIILRFTWDDITKRPTSVVSTVRGALSGRTNDQ